MLTRERIVELITKYDKRKAADAILAEMEEPLAVVADRKGAWFLTKPPHAPYGEKLWLISVARNREYKNVFEAEGETYDAAELKAREFLSTLPDKEGKK